LVHPHPERLESLDRVPDGPDRVGGFLREEPLMVPEALIEVDVVAVVTANG
jgi:hypothetical protein